MSLPGKIDQEFLTFSAFFELTAESDRAFLPQEELDRFLSTCCGMANGNGGWIVLGAAREEGVSENRLPAVKGVADVEQLERRLRKMLQDPRKISVDPVSSFRILTDGNNRLLAVRVESSDWFDRPVCVGTNYLRGTYRRIEETDVVSGHEARFRMALDALEELRDDYVVTGLAVSDLDAASLASFHEEISKRHPHWMTLPREAFLQRALVLNEAGGVTRAGQLLLGTDGAPVRLKCDDQDSEILEAPNLWTACAVLFPCLLQSLPPLPEAGKEALQECFINALLHADHDSGLVVIDTYAELVAFRNPGLPRTRRLGESELRNYRLLRIFKLIGIARGEARGLEIIRRFNPDFRLHWDMFELSTVAELSLKMSLEEPVAAESPNDLFSSDSADTDEFDWGWMPIVQKERGLTLSEATQGTIPLPELKKIPELSSTVIVALEEEQERPAAATGEENPQEELSDGELVSGGDVEPFFSPEIPVAESADDDTEETLDGEDAEEDEYTGSGEDEGDVFSPLVQTVRSTPRLPPAVVRDAIMELCVEYRSLPELASALARSEGSLRRHYITAMVKENLLEMEFPDRVGHPEQRYRIVAPAPN